MAIFASTTTSGYSDPLKALSIKALEQRQKDMLAQMAAQKDDAAMMSTIPGGIGHVLGQVGDSMRQARTDQALAAQKDALAKAISGYDPTSAAPPPDVASLDPEMYKSMMTQFAETRRAQAAQAAAAEQARLGREHTSSESGLTRAQQAELQAKTDARIREEGAAGRTSTEKLAGETNNRITSEGNLTREQQAALQKERLAADAALEDKKLEAAKATAAADPKRAEAVRSAETDYRKGLSHIENLEEAAKILEHPKGIYTGAMQGLAPIAGGIPGANMFVDKEKAQNTSRFNTIVGEDAIRDMSTTLKGSSTNFELQKFEKMKNDPNISDQQRADQLRRAVKSARADLEAQAKEAKTIGGNTERVDAAMKGGGATAEVPRPAGKTDSQLIAEAEAAKKAGKPAAAVDAQLQKWLMGK